MGMKLRIGKKNKLSQSYQSGYFLNPGVRCTRMENVSDGSHHQSSGRKNDVTAGCQSLVKFFLISDDGGAAVRSDQKSTLADISGRSLRRQHDDGKTPRASVATDQRVRRSAVTRRHARANFVMDLGTELFFIQLASRVNFFPMSSTIRRVIPYGTVRKVDTSVP